MQYMLLIYEDEKTWARRSSSNRPDWLNRGPAGHEDLAAGSGLTSRRRFSRNRRSASLPTRPMARR